MDRFSYINNQKPDYHLFILLRYPHIAPASNFSVGVFANFA